ncbi:MAG: glycosyltransferase family 4 protein [Candidatus Saccharibacteria bacterium]
MMSKKLHIAIIAPPWLALPVKGYGGIEVVLEGLISGLQKLDVDVEVFGNGAQTIKGVKTHSIYKTEQFKHIHRPVYDSLPIKAAHLQYSLNYIKKDGTFDIIHDHNGYLGPLLFAWASADPALPPIVHTLHGPPFAVPGALEDSPHDPPCNYPYWSQMAEHMGRCYLIGISDALIRPAPEALRSHILKTVYNAVDVDRFPFVANKGRYFITLARFSPDKGQHIAAKLAVKTRSRLRMAGTVAGIESNRKLLLEIANPLSSYRNMEEFRYYSDKILPYIIRYPRITYSGNLSGVKKNRFISHAKALLFPIDWEEPFGMAVIEALACGTPVIAMNRGAMPEIIQHGVNGFLANDEKEFSEYMQRVDEIDPAVCRQSVIDKFSADSMAEAYLERYKEAIARDSTM